jgi:hypothetical protein
MRRAPVAGPRDAPRRRAHIFRARLRRVGSSRVALSRASEEARAAGVSTARRSRTVRSRSRSCLRCAVGRSPAAARSERPEKADGPFRSIAPRWLGHDDRLVSRRFRGARHRTRTEDNTTVSCTRDASPLASPPASRKSGCHARFGRLEWRDPDSNRGHHDFQKGQRRSRDAAFSLQTSIFLLAMALTEIAAICGRFYPVWATRGGWWPKRARSGAAGRDS